MQQGIDAIKDLIALGREKGFLTYKEIGDSLQNLVIPQQIDDLYKSLHEMGIEVMSDKVAVAVKRKFLWQLKISLKHCLKGF